MDTKAMGERIQIAREERSMTQRDLANVIGCTPQHISAIERGNVGVSFDVTFKLCEVLEITPDKLFDFRD